MLWEKRGCLIDTEKAHIKTGLTSPPANTCLFSHNVMLQLVWRRYAVMSQPQDVLCTLLTRPSPPLSLPPSLPPSNSLSLTLRSANKNVFVQINRRGCSSTFQCIFYEGHAVCCRCCCSDEGPAPPRCTKRKLPSCENALILNKRSALDFEHTGFTHHR